MIDELDEKLIHGKNHHISSCIASLTFLLLAIDFDRQLDTDIYTVTRKKLNEHWQDTGALSEKKDKSIIKLASSKFKIIRRQHHHSWAPTPKTHSVSLPTIKSTDN